MLIQFRLWVCLATRKLCIVHIAALLKCNISFNDVVYHVFFLKAIQPITPIVAFYTCINYSILPDMISTSGHHLERDGSRQKPEPFNN